MNKVKALTILTVIISISLIIPVATASTQVTMGKVSPSGVLFLVVQESPLASGYSPVKENQVIHGGNLRIYVYNPNKNATIPITIEEYSATPNGTVKNLTFQNVTENSPQYQINHFSLSVHLTANQEYLLIGIQGAYYQLQEKYIPTPPMPFYEQGEIAFLLFVMLMSGVTIFLAFGLSLGMLRRGKYFPPVPTLYLIVMSGVLAAISEPILTTDYYQIIQTQWPYYFLPLFAVSTLVFLSKIPTTVQRGLLLRFMADRGNGEVRTQFMSILTGEIELLEANGLRHSGMEYISKRSYTDFIKRLLGFHIPIYFLEGELPAPVERPEHLGLHNRSLKFHLKNAFRFRNLKKDKGEFDFGYLLDQQANPEITKIIRADINTEIHTGTEAERKGLIEKLRILRKARILKIPISGHHSKAIEEFLAGLKESEIKGKRIDEITLENAQLKAEIKARTYYSSTEIIEQMGRIMTGQPPEVNDNDRDNIASAD